MTSDDSILDSCGCGEGPLLLTSTPPTNPPGLPALAYRVGTHGRFNSALQVGLSTEPALRELATRDSSDPAIALLDSWAVVLDVLTFYQERIANEGFLRTATERRSLLELARAIGYELRPGVAASTSLAFTLENVAGSPKSVQFAIGTKAQSVPGQDQKPQLFETIEAIEARPEWNALRPQLFVTSLPLQLGHKKIYLQGTGTKLQPGDALLFIGDERKDGPGSENWDFRRVAAIKTVPLPPTAGPDAGYTVITLDRGLGTFIPPVSPTQKHPEVYALRQRASVFGYNAVDWKALPDVTKLAYLGRPPTGSLTEAEKAEWPNFTIFNSAVHHSAGVLPLPEGSSGTVDAAAGDIFSAAKAAAEKVAFQLDQHAKDAALHSAHSATIGLMGLVQSASTAIGQLTTTADSASTQLMTAAGSFAVALRTLISVKSVSSLNNDTIAHTVSEQTLQNLIDGLMPPFDSNQVGTGLNDLKETLRNFALFLKEPLISFNLSDTNIRDVIISLTALLRLADPIRASLGNFAEATVRTAFSAAQTAASDAMQSARDSANAAAAAAVARESQVMVVAAMQAALDGLIPENSGRSARDHVAEVGREAAKFAVTAAMVQNEAALAAASGAYIEFAPLALGIYAASKLTQEAQSKGAEQIRDAVLDAISKTLNPPAPATASAPATSVSSASAVVSASGYQFDLDAVYPKIVAGKGWVVLSTPSYQEVYRIDAAVESARAEFSLSGKTTRITLGPGEHQNLFNNELRSTMVYAESEQLAFADQPRTDDVAGGEILLAPAVSDLKPGRLLSVNGTAVATGQVASEVVEIKTVATTGNATLITFTTSLTGTYLRSTVTVNANVARATHGETKKEEILGSGDGSAPFQRFVLKQKPLTFISAPVAGGAKSTLEVRVKDVLWQETSSFYGAEPGDRSYVVRQADDGTATLLFGDGVTGARLPTGTNNVKATYRVGLGLAGNLDAGVITTLLSRPLGAKAVTNPVPATGAGDPEVLADARVNAPLTVLTLERIVSVQDFEDFARAFAGIGKAQATLLWNGERQLVHLTVAAANGSAIDPHSDLFQNLLAAIDSARHVDQPLQVSPHSPLTFTLAARIAVDAASIKDDVLAAAKSALASAFSFAARAFGQGVASSEILTVLQNVPGVIAVDLDRLNGLDPILHPNVPAHVAHWDLTTIRGAELLLVDTDGITFTDLPL